MTDLEKAARLALDALELLEQCNYAQGMLTPDAEEEAWEKSDEAIDALRAALAQQQAEPMGGEVERLMSVLEIQDATIKALRAALEQAEPVSAPPKSFRVGYMTGWDDGQRELMEKQQAEPGACGHESCDCRGYCKRKQAEPVPPWYRQFCNCPKCSEAPKQAEPVVEPVTEAVEPVVVQAEPVGWLCSPDGHFKRNPLYRVEFPPESLAWQVPIYAAPQQQAEPAADSGNPSY
jgi:hypothetical protein